MSYINVDTSKTISISEKALLYLNDLILLAK